MTDTTEPEINIAHLMPAKARALMAGKGDEVVKQIGLDVIRGTVCDVLCGKNLRDSTETITRKRLATINAATLTMFLKGETTFPDFTRHLPSLASDRLKKKLRGDERQILQWILGLTNKASQNVLRDSTEHIDQYKDDYIRICQEVVAVCQADYGVLKGTLELSPTEKAEINWYFMVELLQTIGAQTLAIRGSEKSTYGKLFERLILGSLLSILGFKLVPKSNIQNPNKVFWLSSAGDKRESDATLLFQAGQGVRFDIGFIGRGNPEISLDKVSRFEREIEFGNAKWFMATIILVDTIGKRSRIGKLAEAINGCIVQMSMTCWPKQVAIELNKRIGLTHELVTMQDEDVPIYLHDKIAQLPLESFISKART